MGLLTNRNRVLFAPAIAGIFIVAPAFGATVRFDNGGGTNTWENPTNWNTVLAGPDTVIGTGDDINADGLPTSADAASINPTSATGAPLVVNLSSAQSVLEAEVSNGAGATSNIAGTSTLNILPGSVFNLANGGGTGLRVGRSLGAGQTALGQQGSVIQTGGTAFARVRLSPDANSADSLYRISGGNLVAASAIAPLSAGGAATISGNDLIVGATASAFNRSEFHVVGSAATNIRVQDVQVGDSQVVGSTGRAVFHFSLDAAGVTPIVCEDEFQFRAATVGLGSGLLEVDLVGVAPQADVTLVIADRLGNNGGTGATGEHFTNYLDNATLLATGAGYTYTYTVDYTDGSDNFNSADNSGLEASIILRYVSRAEVPEPASVAVLGLGGLLLGRRRRA